MNKSSCPIYNPIPAPHAVIRAMQKGVEYKVGDLYMKFGCQEMRMRGLLRNMVTKGLIKVNLDTSRCQKFYVEVDDKSELQTAQSRYMPEFKELKGTEAARIQFMNNCLAIERRV